MDTISCISIVTKKMHRQVDMLTVRLLVELKPKTKLMQGVSRWKDRVAEKRRERERSAKA
jgi:hypothetical protein